MDALLALSPLDGRYQKIVQPVCAYFNELSLQKYRIKAEIEWLICLQQTNSTPVEKLSNAAIESLRNLYQNFSLEQGQQVKKIEQTTKHDVKSIEFFLTQNWPTDVTADLQSFIHFGLTSEDINNLAYALLLKDFLHDLWHPTLDAFCAMLTGHSKDWAKFPMLSRTHGQPAVGTTLGKEIFVFAQRFARQKQQQKTQPLLAKCNGAAGNFNALAFALPNINWQTLSNHFIRHLGLEPVCASTQIEPHDYLAEIAHSMIRWNTIAIDLSRDIWGYNALGYFALKNVRGEVGSSTMPHKINPIHFENAEGNLGLANSLWSFFAEKLPISRWQRDLSDTTVLRNLGCAFGHSYLALQSLTQGFERLMPNSDKMKKDLNSHWEILLEPVQTLLRLHKCGLQQNEPWQKFRGAQMNATDYQNYVRSLDLPQQAVEKLMGLTPTNYLGYAATEGFWMYLQDQ